MGVGADGFDFVMVGFDGAAGLGVGDAAAGAEGCRLGGAEGGAAGGAEAIDFVIA